METRELPKRLVLNPGIHAAPFPLTLSRENPGAQTLHKLVGLGSRCKIALDDIIGMPFHDRPVNTSMHKLMQPHQRQQDESMQQDESTIKSPWQEAASASAGRC